MVSKKMLITAIFISLIIILSFLFGAKLYLIFNALIGNDVIVKINLDKENLFLSHNQEDTIKVRTTIVANPFCSIYCNYSLKSLSFNQDIESNNFSLKTITPVSKEFKIKAPSIGTGQDLYSFEIHCNSKNTALCDTTEEIKSRTVLITLNYNLTEIEEYSKQTSKTNLISLAKVIDFYDINLVNHNNKIISLNKSPDMVIFSNKYKTLSSSVLKSKELLNKSVYNWNFQDYASAEQNINLLIDKIKELNQSSNNFFTEFSLYAYNYNSQINNTLLLYEKLSNLSSLNLTKENSENLSFLISDYNQFLLSYDNFSYGLREQSLNKLQEQLNLLLQSINNQDPNASVYLISYSPSFFNKSYINLSLIQSNYSLLLEESRPICCFNSICNYCCNVSCSDNKSLFSILFVHGHKFNQDISAESNLHSFEEIQKSLEQEGYVNSGFIFASQGIPGILSKINYPLSFSMSYYFDTVKDSDGEAILESKKDSIDTYALRLNEIIKEIKSRTGKEKIILITHSMGGLVARRYLQIFGENDVEKLVLIMTPNQGISGKILSYCNIFGSEVECNNMDKTSVFISKLNSAAPPKIPVYNIIGLGCDMDGEQGDGIVTNSTAYLPWAKTYNINGTCDDLRFKYLHNEILYPSKHPELVILLKEILNSA